MRRRPAPEVQVLTAPAAVASARAAGEAYARRVSPAAAFDPLKWLARARLSHDEMARFAQERARVVPRLRETAAGSGAPAAAACISLAWLGQPEYMDRLLELLSSPPSATIGESLQAIARSSDLVRELPGFEALRPRLLAHAEDRNHPHRLMALQAAFEFDAVPRGTDVVDALVQSAASQSFVEPWIEHALGLLVRRGGETALPAAQALLRAPLLGGMNAIRAGRSRDARLVPDLERALASAVRKDVQAGVLQALAYVQGRDAVPRLLDALALADRELAHGVATGLGIAAADTGDESVVAALTRACVTAPYVGWHAMAIARIGGPLAMRTLAGLVKRVDLFSAMYIAWRAQGVTAAVAVRRFVDSGIIPRGPAESGLAAEAGNDWAGEPADVGSFWNVLRRSGRWVETSPDDRDDQEYARHTRPLTSFAAATGGRVAIEHVSQTDGVAASDGTRESIVRFVWGERAYEVTAISEGRTFDLRAVLALLNEALGDRGYPERFVRLEGHDTVQAIFGDPRAVESVCDDLSIPHGPDRSCLEAWRNRIESVVKAAARPDIVSRPVHALAFHLFCPTRPERPFPDAAVSRLIAETIRTPVTTDVDVRPGWTTLRIHLTREQFIAHGPAAIEALFESLCETVDAHLARTDTADGWALIAEGELAGAIDAVDWIQYFGPGFGNWIGSKHSSLAEARTTAGGAQIVTLRLDPSAPSWVARQEAAEELYVALRPLPPAATDEVDPARRLERTRPPAPREWTPQERRAMLDARRRTLQIVDTGMADERLFDRFRRLYLPDGLEDRRLDTIETWLPHYGAEVTAAAFRAVARLHEDHPDGPPLDQAALEGCVKLVSWGGAELPLAARELLAGHLVDVTDPSAATFALQTYEPNAVAGMMKLTAAFIKRCTCDRCAEIRRAGGF